MCDVCVVNFVPTFVLEGPKSFNLKWKYDKTKRFLTSLVCFRLHIRSSLVILSVMEQFKFS